MGSRSQSSIERRTARLSTLATVAFGVATVALTWGFDRLGVLHPHPFLPLFLFFALAASLAVALACGVLGVVRGPRRLTALGLMTLALVLPAFWGWVGVYAAGQWRRRLVPNDLPMDLAKMAAAPLMRLEASAEYPNRLETDHLVMLYGRLDDPRRDADEMDRHLARMEGMLGGPFRAKVYWVRGGLPLLGIGSLSVHGIALGSAESPADWDRGGGFDRHELAHAALDEYRTYDSDPPCFLHEGWANSQKGVGSVALARRAHEQRSETPGIGIREMLNPEWYHRDEGAVYSLGGAFVDYLLRTYGVGAFVRLYNGCRPDTAEETFRKVLGSDLDTVEAAFWRDVRERVGED